MKYAYRKLTPFVKRSYNAKYRARKYNANGNFTARTITNLYVKQRGNCAICLKSLFGDFETDHIKPLSKGGDNSPSNIQLLCLKCNREKSDKIEIINCFRHQLTEKTRRCRLCDALTEAKGKTEYARIIFIY